MSDTGKQPGASIVRVAVPLVGVGLMIVGVIAVLVDLMTPVSFGWFAYAPLSEEVAFSPPRPVMLSWSGALGVLAALLGVAALAGWAGYRLGCARASVPPSHGQG